MAKIKHQIGNCEIANVNTDYPNRPPHRGHTVVIDGWNEEYVLLIIKSDDGKTNEAIISPEQLMELATKAKQEAWRW